MFAMKYHLEGPTPLLKLNQLEEYVRNMMQELEKDLKRKEEEVEKRFVLRENRMKEEI